MLDPRVRVPLVSVESLVGSCFFKLFKNKNVPGCLFRVSGGRCDAFLPSSTCLLLIKWLFLPPYSLDSSAAASARAAAAARSLDVACGSTW